MASRNAMPSDMPTRDRYVIFFPGSSAEEPTRRELPAPLWSERASSASPTRLADRYDLHMTELRVVVSNEVAERLAERARREHTTPEELATEAVRSYVGVTGISMLRRLGFVGLGHSGRSDISERAEEILRADFGA